MLLIGLTGPSGAGKGLFCRILLDRYGIGSIDADAVYHALLVPPSPCLDALCETFGEEILREDGTLDRKKLASIVFSPEDATVRNARIEKLNTITHHFVLDRCDEILKKAARDGKAAMILDAPALFEAGADRRCDLLVAVTADRDVRIARITARDGISEEAAVMRVRSQHDNAFYESRVHAVLRNNGTEEDFTAAVSDFYDTHLKERLS